MKVAITTTSFGKQDPSPLELMKKEGVAYVINPYGRKLCQEEIVELIEGVDGIIAGTEPLTRKVLESSPSLRVISRCGVGMDNVDVTAAEERGIRIFNTPYGPTLAVAELTVGLILDLLRNISWMDRELRNLTWKKKMGNLVQGKRIGIVGFGRIGQKVAELLLPFGVDIGYCDLCDVSNAMVCTSYEMETLLAWADIISLHVSVPSHTGPVLGEREIRLMKKGAWLINVARGGVLDEKALFEALANGHLAGAALDVFEKEPYYGPLSAMDNVVLTPHIGSYALESRIIMEKQAVENLLIGLRECGQQIRNNNS